MAERVSADVSMPRIACRQQHRRNPQACTPKDYHKKSIAKPLLDHILSAMETQFSDAATVASSVLGLVSSVCCSREGQLDRALEKYAQDLPSPKVYEAELRRWKRRFTEQSADTRPSSPAQAIKACDSDMFPNISVLLQISFTLPVTSCECETSASALRRLQNYMRETIRMERLSSLDLLHVHYDKAEGLHNIVKIFCKLHPRRLELSSLIKPE